MIEDLLGNLVLSKQIYLFVFSINFTGSYEEIYSFINNIIENIDRIY